MAQEMGVVVIPVKFIPLEVVAILVKERMADAAVHQSPFKEAYKEVFECLLSDASREVLFHPGLHQVIYRVNVVL